MVNNLADFDSPGSWRMLRCSAVSSSSTLFFILVSESQNESDLRIASLTENFTLYPDQFYSDSLVSNLALLGL